VSTGSITDIYIVRHGETDWNRAQRLQGSIDTPLNFRGVAQANRLADRFYPLGIASTVTSPLARARNTAVVIARRNHSAVVAEARLAEIDHGSWAGLTLSTIARSVPGVVVEGQLHPDALNRSGGETLAAAYDRASAVLRHLVSGWPAAPVIVISHGITNALLMCAATGMAPTQIARFTQSNGCIHRLLFRRRVLVAMECVPPVALVPDALVQTRALQRGPR
jgi:broad specificity phosphatase PhoE